MLICEYRCDFSLLTSCFRLCPFSFILNLPFFKPKSLVCNIFPPIVHLSSFLSVLASRWWCIRYILEHYWLPSWMCTCSPSHSSVFLLFVLPSLIYLSPSIPSSKCPPPPYTHFPSLAHSLTVCHLAVFSQTGFFFMAADMWQFPFVNDKKCANYLSGCFTANQTLTSCEREHLDVCV